MKAILMEQYIFATDSVRLWTLTYGQKKNEACLFINGAGANTSCWSERLWSGLVEKGFFVMTYDHRDSGYSDKVDFETHPFDVMDLAIDYTRNLYERQEMHGALGASHVKAQANLTDRTELRKKVKIPALIIHGEEDYLVDTYGGIQTARSILNSQLEVVPNMGHMLFNKEIKDKVEDLIIQYLWSQKCAFSK